VLLLILADGDIVGLIQQDVRRHKGGIRKQAAIDVVGMLGGFVFELGHAGKLAEHGVAVQDPAQLSVLMHMALDEQSVFLRVEAAGNVLGKLGHGTAAQLLGVLTYGYGMEIRHKIKTVKFIGKLGPVFHSAQIIAQVQVA